MAESYYKTISMISPRLDSLGVIYAFLGAFFVALEAILSKRGLETGASPLFVSIVVTSTTAIIFWSFLAFSGGLRIISNQSFFPTAVFFLSGVIGSGIGAILIYQGIDRVGASINTAIINSRPIFAVGFGFLLSEFPPISTLFGIAILVLGIVVISLSKGGDLRGWTMIDLLFPLGAALSFSIGNVIRRYGLTRTDISVVHAIAINAVGGLVILLYVGSKQGRAIVDVPAHTYGWAILTGISASGSLLAMFVALERENVAIVESLLALAPLLTIILAAVFLRDFERITMRVVYGAILVVTGSIRIVTI